MSDPYYQDDLVTLYHGDCLTETAWLAADVLVTDPPYGMSFDSGWVKGRTRAIANDGDTEARDKALRLWADRGPWLMFGTWRVQRPAEVSQVLIWDKTDGVGPGMGDLSAAFGSSHEEIYLGGKWKKAGPRRGSVIRTSTAMGNPYGLVATSGHPTPKPIGLMEVLIAQSAAGVIADPFAGSGATLLAARNLGRQAIGVELEERYCELIAKRLSQQVFDFGDVA